MTALQRGTVLGEAITRVADHRQVQIGPLSSVLDGDATITQPRWRAWRRKQQLINTPEQFAELLATVIDFTDPRLQS